MNNHIGPSPGAARHPQHSVTIRPDRARWRAVLNGQLLADSADVLVLEESGFQPVIYFPPKDVHTTELQRSDSRTTCPFKGEAAYWQARVGEDWVDVAWFYPAVYREVEPIADYVAFYADRVNVDSELPHGK
jgi:uncharacterized protein (DUF427 family)